MTNSAPRGSWHTFCIEARDLVVKERNLVKFQARPGLPDLGMYPKILGIFEGDWIFLGTYCFRKELWGKSWEL